MMRMSSGAILGDRVSSSMRNSRASTLPVLSEVKQLPGSGNVAHESQRTSCGQSTQELLLFSQTGSYNLFRQ